MAGQPPVRQIAKLNVAALARTHGEKAIKTLADKLDDPDPRVAIDAATKLLDRGYGRPLNMTADVTNKIEEFDDESLDAAISVLRSAIGADGQVDGGEDAPTTH